MGFATPRRGKIRKGQSDDDEGDDLCVCVCFLSVFSVAQTPTREGSRPEHLRGSLVLVLTLSQGLRPPASRSFALLDSIHFRSLTAPAEVTFLFFSLLLGRLPAGSSCRRVFSFFLGRDLYTTLRLPKDKPTSGILAWMPLKGSKRLKNRSSRGWKCWSEHTQKRTENSVTHSLTHSLIVGL